MTLTAKQRAKIYRRAAENMEKHKSGPYSCCVEIVDAAEALEYREQLTLRIMFTDTVQKSGFDELFAFLDHGTRSTGHWWDKNDRGSRILALLFSEQMALDSIKTKK